MVKNPEITITDNDNLRQYCSMLGHEVSFRYCRSMNSNFPCQKYLSCWKNTFKIDEFINHFYSEAEIKSFLRSPKPKIIQIYDLMLKASRNSQKK